MNGEISIKDLLRLLHKNLLLIIICAAIGLTGTFVVVNFFVKPVYISTVKLYVYTKGDDQNSSNYNNLNDLNYIQKIVNTYIEMLRTSNFYKDVIDQCNLSYSIKDLKKMVDFTVLNDTEVIQVSVSSNSPEDSKKIADTITSLAPHTISSIKETSLLRVVESANFPDTPSSPNKLLDSGIGFILGIVIAICIAIYRNMFDVRIKNEDDLSLRYNVPILGAIPIVETSKEKSQKGARRARWKSRRTIREVLFLMII